MSMILSKNNRERGRGDTVVFGLLK